MAKRAVDILIVCLLYLVMSGGHADVLGQGGGTSLSPVGGLVAVAPLAAELPPPSPSSADEQNPGGISANTPAASRAPAQATAERAFGAAVTLIATFLLTYLLSAVRRRRDAVSDHQQSGWRRLIPIAQVALWSSAILLIATILLDGPRAVIAVAALALALALAVQDILKNLFGGMVLLIDAPFVVGDRVTIGDCSGEVMSVTLLRTRIRMPNGDVSTVPNMRFMRERAVNATSGARTRHVSVDLFLPGDADVARARELAYEVAVNSRYVYLEKPVQVHVRDEFGAGHMTRVVVEAHVIDARFARDLVTDVTEAAKGAFVRDGLIEPARAASGAASQELLGNGEG